MKTLTGIGKIDRERIAAIIRGTKGAKMLSRWAKKGWMSRVRRGLYISIPLESRTADVPLEDPWLIAERLFAPCYVGGWSAAEYLDLTEQIFSTVMVMTVQKPRDRRPKIKGTNFMLRTVSEKAMFGLKPVWRGRIKVPVSDPTRTILDMLSNPVLGGGIRSTKDMFINYLRSENKNLELLIEYAERLGNGFLLEKIAPDEMETIDKCRLRLTAGNTKLDPKLSNDKLITRWRLWVPENWKRLKQVD
jgi:predicted transcriptional regulator of viral defense system